MYLANLHALHKDMVTHEAKTCVFAARVNKKPFNCTFTEISFPYYLYITSLGEHPFTIPLKIDSYGFYIRDGQYIDSELYERLCDYLELRRNDNSKFRPVDFFKDIDIATPRVFNGRTAAQHQVTQNFMDTHPDEFTDEDRRKPYFCGWQNDGISKHVTYSNRLKSLTCFPQEEVDLRTKLNQSSCWTNNPDKERLDLINQRIAEDGQF